jgi:hypothetical protein
MSAAAPPSRSRRGPRQCLPLVVGLAFLAGTIGAEYGVAPAGETVRPAVIGQSTAAVSTDGWAGPERTLDRDSPGWQRVDGTDRPAPVGGQNLGPVTVPAFWTAPPAPDGQPAAPRTTALVRGGVAPAPGGPRAPPVPVG